MHNLTRTFLLRVVMIPIAYGEPAHAQENACAPGVSLNSKVIVLVLTTDDRDEWVFDAIHSGASGYLLKDSPRTTLIQVVKDAAVGRTPVGPNVAGKLFAHVSQHTVHSNTTITNDLSTRETEILKLLARGFPNTDIAQQLYLSEGTVRNYVSAIFTKLEVADRTQAAVKALRYGLVNLHDL